MRLSQELIGKDQAQTMPAPSPCVASTLESRTDRSIVGSVENFFAKSIQCTRLDYHDQRSTSQSEASGAGFVRPATSHGRATMIITVR